MRYKKEGEKKAGSNSPHSDVKDIAAHRAGHGHVSKSFPGHDHAGDEVRNGRAGSQDSQAHYLLGDSDCLAHLQE